MSKRTDSRLNTFAWGVAAGSIFTAALMLNLNKFTRDFQSPNVDAGIPDCKYFKVPQAGTGQFNDTHDRPDRLKAAFREDQELPKLFRSRISDYRDSGFDRGHLAPAADVTGGQDAMNETFLLSNISPQVASGFNRGYWASLEHFVRDLTNTFDEFSVVTGPLYLPHQENDGKYYVKYQMLGNPPNTAVPTHFFKAILGKNGDDVTLGAFILPNSPISVTIPLSEFEIALEVIERSAGVSLFSGIDRKSATSLCQKVECGSMRKLLPKFNGKDSIL
ncbi:nuclease, partial [Nowakowskiella sp. JEL0078]